MKEMIPAPAAPPAYEPRPRYNPYRYNVQTTYTSAAMSDYKTAVIYSLIGLGAIGGVVYAGHRMIRQAQINRQERNSTIEGNPATYAKQFKMAFDNDNVFGWGTNEDQVFNTITAIPTKKMYSKVQDSYYKLYARNLNADLEDELSSDEYNRFINILSSKKQK